MNISTFHAFESQSMPWETQSRARAHDLSESISNEYLTFDDFLLQFDKTYSSNEDYQYRKNIYESNIDYIQNDNQNFVPFRFGSN